MKRRDWSLSDRTKNRIAYALFLLLMLLAVALGMVMFGYAVMQARALYL